MTNNINIDVEMFSNREKFLELYPDKILKGWIFSCATNLDEVISVLQDDTCCLVEFGFNSDTETKALEVGRSLVASLNKFKFMAHWDERSLKEHKITTVVTTEDLPEAIQNLVATLST